MHLRKIAVGLSALVLLSTGAQARGLLDLITPHPQHTSRSGSIGQGAALDLYSSQQKKPSFDSCADLFPARQPINTATVPATMKPLALCSDNFAVLYSQTSKTPLVVVERLNAGQLQDAKGEERTNQFYPDPRIPKGARAELSDYRGQHPAVDRGHQSPAADAPSTNAMAQSFALSNMVPQDPTNNRKIWSKVEADVRKFAKRADGNVFVFTGPLFDPGYSTIGDNKVWVPTRLFKLVYDVSSQRAWAYVLPNAETRIEKPMDYATFVKTTGLKLLGNLPVTGSVGRT
ncbi:DNA/RNA non-specific endonuclease [Pseudomonas yamanorum]|uniref:Endonuclease n=1 Tax=Pseudomonas yamanorum TaxID=515393 RepID=A0A7Y8EIR4_9PSED|nr:MULTISPECIES: DNA/RNA non-specific endonuclease [Pseudomonas]MCS3418120.1 endonuclease G [Pseudomonas sp. BIGb0558]MCS3437632.1 endonuclease G [Pseudomonas sp. BIGb0450]NVZ84411.1 DNA/RNA non-specific endonuclease [Pseudomonas yamanorum]NWD25284.1 DNA/RNA non-specific endonuclease [Pseudomonas yamanorum]NWE15441.1 DNA/RNA non-specific endonuclease [Pseudomonas yamanorum]